MAQRGVENPSLAVVATPCQREVSIVPSDSRRAQIDGARVEGQQHVHAIARKIAELVDFIGKAKGGRERLRHRMIRILHPNRNLLSPWVPVEPGADELAI